MLRDARLEREFQEMVIAEGKKLGGFVANFKPNKVRAMKQHVGKGLWMTYVQRPKFTRVELYIYRGKDNYKDTMELFDYFIAHKGDIDKAYGAYLNWDDNQDKNACRIEITYNDFDLHADKDSLYKYAMNMAADMNTLNSVLEPYYSKL